MMIRLYDPTLGRVETPQGTMTLSKVFLPFFLEMFLMNLMNTVNTFTLSFYSDEAVAAVGAAGQFMGMIITFYTVISTGASIVISQNVGAGKKENAADAAFFSPASTAGLLSIDRVNSVSTHRVSTPFFQIPVTLAGLLR